MEVINEGLSLREDKQLLVLTHLSQLLDFVTGIGGFIVPLILWLVNKDRVLHMDVHGKAILNFRISLFFYCILSIPCILLFGLGILMLIGLGLLALIAPITNAVRASNDQPPYYPLSISFFS